MTVRMKVRASRSSARSARCSRYYAAETLSNDGVVQTEADLIPDWFAPLTKRGYKSEVLPLWCFVAKPSRASAA